MTSFGEAITFEALLLKHIDEACCDEVSLLKHSVLKRRAFNFGVQFTVLLFNVMIFALHLIFSQRF